MNRHQVLTGACNSGDQCFAVGSVEGLHFTAYAAGCDIAILASDFQRVQIIPGVTHGNIKVSCVDCSSDTGKIAASYQSKVYIFEPTPLLQHETSHKLDYCWYKTASFTADCFINCLSWNVDGSKLLIGGEVIQIWQLASSFDDDLPGRGVHFQLGGSIQDDDEVYLGVGHEHLGCSSNIRQTSVSEQPTWVCAWQCRPATPVYHLKFSPDGLLFASAGTSDRVVKIWFEDKKVQLSTLSRMDSHPSPRKEELHYSFVYVAHPRAVTGFCWRKTSKYMPRGSVANMLVTSCRDNVCRIWCETILPDDGLIDLDQFDPSVCQDPRYHTHRHKKRFIQRLKTIRHAINKRKKHRYGPETVMTSPQLSGAQSVHDFHKFAVHQNGIAPAFHFHLSGSINPKTDFPLQPIMGNMDEKFNFQLNWLNNKELEFTTEAENILQMMHKKMSLEEISRDNPVSLSNDENIDGLEDEVDSAGQDENSSGTSQRKKRSSRLFRKLHSQGSRSIDSQSECQTSLNQDSFSENPDSVSNENISLNETLDRKIENLLRDWHQRADMLFSIHPQDGSFLVWLVDWLDEYKPFCFRQSQVSFSCRIPHAVPVLDARTKSSSLLLYCNYSKMDIRSAMKLIESKQNINGRGMLSESAAPMGKSSPGQSDNMLIPNVLMLSKHLNGTLNLWQISFAENSKFSTVVSIAHVSRACGHRFRTTSASCHPVLPLLLTTSHHNIPEADSPINHTLPPLSEENESGKGGFEFCSELILWKVDPVGPLSKSGGIVELARINSPHISAFSNVSWIPTLLPSNTLGCHSNSSSTLFVASDGYSLRLYQAVIDAHKLLIGNTTSKKSWTSFCSNESPCTDDSQDDNRETKCINLFNIVSLQSTAHPGCIIQLERIADAKQDWQETQLLHVFQEQLLTGKVPEDAVLGNMEAIVDLRNLASFKEHFYLILLEKATHSGSVVHMWKITISSQPVSEEYDNENSSSEDLQQTENNRRLDLDRSQIPPGSSSVKLSFSTVKVCSQSLPLADNVEVICATTAAGHLSSASIYPACLAPYLLVTACSNNRLYFWHCHMTEIEPYAMVGDGSFMEDCLFSSVMSYQLSTDDSTMKHVLSCTTETMSVANSISYEWLEWKMISQTRNSSSISIPGRPITVCCAYSGRLAVAYRFGAIRAMSEHPNNKFVNLCVAIYECESTGGSEWTLEDTIELNNISIPDPKAEIDLNLIFNSDNSTLPTFRIGEDYGHGAVLNSPSLTNLKRTKSVPSLSTIHSVKKSITEQGNKTGILVQKHLVQLDWVSSEDGSHVLTVGVGSKLFMYAQVSEEIAVQASQKPVMSGNPQSRQKRLQKSKSIVVDNYQEEIRWMKLRAIELTTADSLPPLPMHISWVRAGILVVGMDNEVHVYSQWKGPICNLDSQGMSEAPADTDKRSLSDFSLPTLPSSTMLSSSKSMQNIKHLSTPSAAGYSKKRESMSKKGSLTKSESIASLTLITDLGLFETARQANPVLPQYHPKQLMELLNFGRIKRVKAILSHLVRCIAGSDVYQATYPVEIDAQDGKVFSLHKQRGMSVSGTSPNEAATILEEQPLDYIEIISIPPLPIYALLAADNDCSVTTDMCASRAGQPASQDYTGLFESNIDDDDDDDDDIFTLSSSSPRQAGLRGRHLSTSGQAIQLHNFGLSQAQLLVKHLTHMQLPGLTSLDQMYLLALADTIANTRTELADGGTQMGPQDDNDRSLYQAAESMDECGLKFLLALRYHIYLLRTLPPRQRLALQSEGLRSQNIVWAFHSEATEELLSLVPGMQKGEPTWQEMKQFGVGWWLTNITLLKRTMEKLAKVAFQTKKDPMDAAIFYLAMKKKNVLWGLFRSNNNKKMGDFFKNDFTQERWRKAALNNAFALLGRQRFMHAAAFFLLGNSLNDAVEVCLEKLHDIQLALTICRLYDGEEFMPESAKKILYKNVLGCDSSGENYRASKAHPDPFLRSMSLWMIKDHIGALNTLLQAGLGAGHTDNEQDEGEKCFSSTSVFNFCIYLRSHPLIVRHQKLSKASSVTVPGNKASSACNNRITPVERRLFFTTAHAHFKNGCPLLALEVLCKLPSIVDPESFDMEPGSEVLSGDFFSDQSNKTDDNVENLTKGSQLSTPDQTSGSIDWGKPASPMTDLASGFDWSMPVTSKKMELGFDNSSSDSDNASSEANRNGLFQNSLPVKDVDVEDEESKIAVNRVGVIDIMVQQYKFIACLKVMMEELRTLATGFEVDGGQLRYQLYIWLEREVDSLRLLCNYGGGDEDFPPTVSANLDLSQDSDTGNEDVLEQSGSSSVKPSLHEVIIAEKMDFRAKLARVARRKQWLKKNQQLLRTLLSYCILQGPGVGGLASVQMELLLLLQELQQERTQKQLLSPLPFPTTLPLLSASMASSKTVIADPIQYLQCLTQDLLHSIVEFTVPPSSGSQIGTVFLMRNLSIALSSSIYQCLCDIDSFVVMQNEKTNIGYEGFTSHSVGCQASHLMASVQQQQQRARLPSGEESVNTPPSKWPGVSTLCVLLAHEKEDNGPGLNILLCESLVAVYVSLLISGLATYDVHMLFRLVAHKLDQQTWSALFGGGVKSVVKKTPNVIQVKGDNFQRHREKFNMMVMGAGKRLMDDKPTYQEYFVPPELSMITYFMTKPFMSASDSIISYDSNSSLSSEETTEDSVEDNDDFQISDRPKSLGLCQMQQHNDPNSYSWCIIRYAIVRLVLQNLKNFLPLVAVELQELPVISPLLHATLKTLEQWEGMLQGKLELFAGPPNNYIPQLYLDVENGIPQSKYDGLLHRYNTPFINSHSTLALKRLWFMLVKQDFLRDIFIRYIFRKKKFSVDTEEVLPKEDGINGTEKSASPMKIIHKEQDIITAFTINQANMNYMVLSTQKELVELDIGALLCPPAWLADEVEYDIETLTNPILPGSDGSDFVLVNTPFDQPYTAFSSPSTPYNSSVPSMPSAQTLSSTGRGTTVMLQRPVPSVRRIGSHPHLPHYLAGSADGSVRLWEWGHHHTLSVLRQPGTFSKVTKALFNTQGNKCCVSDAEGSVCLWQVGIGSSFSKPIMSLQCHNKTTSDFAFVGSSSLIATAGHSSESKNVCLWDTLLPSRSSLVHAFTCHEHGSPAIAYAPQHQLLITGGRKGEICIFDMRQRQMRHTFQAHEAPIKSLSLDPEEAFFATGSAEGDIKVWGLDVHQLLYSFVGEHIKTTFFRNVGSTSGVTQVTVGPLNHLFSCGVDGSLKVRMLPE